ncbi:ABHD15 [Branchiostoma lanceolatum]|uniref:ABHD15 protein n=1 Tax=Branchiostoma lanceolatum TaxID=7740 RepID=A0A8J9VBN1_BRALA|nr:ABHD15 [Branchiostoma lanceolatum]
MLLSDGGNCTASEQSGAGSNMGNFSTKYLEVVEHVLTPSLYNSWIVLTVFALWMCMKCAKRVDTPEFVSRDSLLKAYFQEKCFGLKTALVLMVWAHSCHVQTVLGMIVSPDSPRRFVREYVEMKDGGIIGLDWDVTNSISKPVNALKKAKVPSRPVLLVVYGTLATGAGIDRICTEAGKQGLQAVVFRRRGQDYVPLTTPRLQSFGDPSDLREAVEYIKAVEPNSEIVALSVSTGCGLLFSYLGEYGSSTHIASAACISPVYSAREFYESSSIPTWWQKLWLQRQKLVYMRHSTVLYDSDSDYKHCELAMRSRTLTTFHQRVHVKLNKYNSWDQYWAENEPLRDVDEVATPLLCVSSKDDPLVPEESIPIELFQTYPHFFLALTEKGGHCGFFQGLIPSSWSERLAIEFLKVSLDMDFKKSIATS